MKTKLFVCLSLLVALQVDARWIFQYTTEEQECLEQLNIDGEVFRNEYIKSSYDENNIELNGFLHCVWKKLGFQNQAGDIDYSKLKQSYGIARKVGEDNPEILLRIDELRTGAVSACENDSIQGSSPGQTAVKVQNCIVKNYFKLKYPQ